MSDSRATELTELTAIADDDWLYAVDISDTTDSPQGSSRKVQAKNARGIPITSAETAASVTIVNYQYEPGNVLRYGTNTTPGTTDMTTALTNALLAYDTVYIPAGTYLISSAVSLADNQLIYGDSWRATILSLSGTATRFNMADWSTIRDLRIDGDGTQTFGISSTATASRWTIDRVWVSDCVSGIGLNNSWINTIRDCVIRGCTQGIYVHDGLSSNGPVNAINIFGGEIASCTYGIRFGTNGGSSFSVFTFNIYGMTIEPSGTYGIWVEDVGIRNMLISGVHFEQCGDACYRQDVGVNIVTFESCVFSLDDNAATDKGIDITAGSTLQLNVIGNRFTRSSGSSATDGLSLGASAIVSRKVLIGNNWSSPVIPVDNISGSRLTHISDGYGGANGTVLPFGNYVDLRELVTTTNVITAAESGSTFYLNAAGGFTSTLPAPAAGLKYTFIVKTAPTTSYIVTTDSGDNILYGTYLDIVGELVYFSAQDTINFVASTSVIGDRLEVESDGTNWYCKATSGANGGITTSAT